MFKNIRVLIFVFLIIIFLLITTLAVLNNQRRARLADSDKKTDEVLVKLSPTGIITPVATGPVTTSQISNTIKSHQSNMSVLPLSTQSNIRRIALSLPVNNSYYELAFSNILQQFFIFKKKEGAEEELRIYLQQHNLRTLYLTHPQFFTIVQKPVAQAIEENEKPLINMLKTIPNTLEAVE